MTGGPFDGEEGERRKEDGMDRAARHSNPEWWQFILETGKEIAERKPIMSIDDLYNEWKRRRPDLTTHDPAHALGAAMRAMAHLGYVVATQDMVRSDRKTNHGRRVTVWYSLIYRGNVRVIRPRRRRMLDPRQFQFPLGYP